MTYTLYSFSVNHLKQYVGLVAALYLCIACQSDIYFIIGEASELPSGSILYLTDDVSASRQPFDSIVISDGRFHYRGTVVTPHITMLYPAASQQHGFTFFTEPGNIYIELSPTTERSRVSGTVINNRWQALNDSVAKYDSRIRHILGTSDDTVALRQRYEGTRLLYDQLTQIISSAALLNKENALGRFISSHHE